MLALHTSLPLPSRLKQIDGLQLLRAVAVIEVAWGHAGTNLNAPAYRFNLGIFGVDIFFVISGFILSSVILREQGAPGIRSMWSFLSRRLIRIFPVYWFFCVLAGARMIWSHQALSRAYLPSVLLLPSPTQLHQPWIVAFGWTLVFEMFFYYLLSFILLVTVRRAVPVMLVILLLLVATGSCFVGAHPILIVVCNPILLEFAFGACVALLYAEAGRLVSLGQCLTAAGIAAAAILALFPPAGAAESQHMLLINTGALARAMTWGIGATLIVAGMVFWSPPLRGGGAS